MAKSETKTTKKVEKDNKVEEVKKVEKVQEENSEVATLKKQLEEMKKAMKELMDSKAAVPSQGVVIRQQEDEVVIGCRVMQGVGWGDPAQPGGEIRLRFNEEQTVTVSDMKIFFRKHSVRKLFEDGLCYFTNPEDYVIFNIRKTIDLSNENLINILNNKDINEIIRKLDDITENKKKSNIINCIVFRICDMIRKSELNWDYYARTAVESYFGMEFERGIRTLDAIDRIRE